MSQEDFAKKFSAKYTTLTKIESNVIKKPSVLVMAKIANIEGEVKAITLRRTIIKDETGFLHFIPNSQIKLVSKKLT